MKYSLMSVAIKSLGLERIKMAEDIGKGEHSERLRGETGIFRESLPDSRLWELPFIVATDFANKNNNQFLDQVTKITQKRKEELFSHRIQYGAYSEFSGDVLYESRQIKEGTIDLLTTSTKSGTRIASEGGYKIVPNRLIYPKNNNFKQSTKKLMDLLKTGDLHFNVIRWGGLSSVGFAKGILNGDRDELAFKYFNYKPEAGVIRKNTIIDGVTGVGQYVFSRKIQAASEIKVPEPIMASNEVLVMKSIKGKTLRHFMDEGGNGDKWERWWETMIKPYIKEILQNILDEGKDEYWQPDYIHLDIHRGNIIIDDSYNSPFPPGNINESLKMFTLIDPIR